MEQTGRGAAQSGNGVNAQAADDGELSDPRFLPFERRDAYGLLGLNISPLQKVALVLFSVLAVLKLVGAFLCLLSFWACCHLSVVLPPSARTRIVAVLGRVHTRLCLLCLGFVYLRWVRVPPPAGQPAALKPAAIVSNHCSWTDILIMMSHFFPAFVARHYTASMPFVGVIR